MSTRVERQQTRKLKCEEYTLKRVLQGFPTSTCIIAISGGVDSIVLTDLYYQLQQACLLENPKAFLSSCQLIHFHHGLSPNADLMAAHCQSISKKYGFPLEIIHLNLKPIKGESIEALARTARYHHLASRLKPQEILLTAHHQDDQAETLLLQLIRGAGIQGLAAMPPQHPLGKGTLLRPLLSHTRVELIDYATQQQLTWIEDVSNEDERFDRNFIRKNIMPVLRQRWPSVSRTLSRSAQLCANTAKIITDSLTFTLAECCSNPPQILYISHLKKHAAEKQAWIFRQWLENLAVAIPTYQQWQVIERQLINGKNQKGEVRWADIRLVKYQNNLFVIPKILPTLPTTPISWNIEKPLRLSEELGTLKAIASSQLGIQISEKDEVRVEFRKGGEWCKPVGRVGSHPLKKCFQEWQIPQEFRKYIPLIYLNNYLVGVANFTICPPFPEVHSPEKSYQFLWEYPENSFFNVLKFLTA